MKEVCLLLVECYKKNADHIAIHETREGARAGLYDYVLENWEDVIGGDNAARMQELIDAPDKELAIQMYFCFSLDKWQIKWMEVLA